MGGTASIRLMALLEATGLFSPSQVEELAIKQRENDGVLTATVVSLEYAREDLFLAALAKAMRVPFLRVGDTPIAGEVLEKVPTKAVFQYNVVPVGIEGGILRVATSEPFRPNLADALRLASGLRVRFALSPAADIEKAAKKFYGVGADTLDRLLADNALVANLPGVVVGRLVIAADDVPALLKGREVDGDMTIERAGIARPSRSKQAYTLWFEDRMVTIPRRALEQVIAGSRASCRVAEPISEKIIDADKEQQEAIDHDLVRSFT